MSNYPLKTILSTFSNTKGNKRTVFNAGPIGGINSNFIKLFLLSLPFVEYALIFNPTVFNALGIAAAIVFFIVFLSIVMIIVFLVVWSTKKSVIKKITPSWEQYFQGKDINMVLSSGITPYSDFFKYYSKIVNDDLSEEELQKSLLESFKLMEAENKDLIDAMSRER